MKFLETALSGVFKIELEPLADSRGFFARSWCRREFEEHGLNARLAQCDVSFNVQRGTLRGIHYQDEPSPEAKLVRCTHGAIYDVALDLRPASPTFLRHAAAVLTASNHTMLYLPEGCGHGFLTLEDDTEVFYQMSEFYIPGLSRGYRWDDPAFDIPWPEPVRIISERDSTYPDFRQPVEVRP